MKISAVCCICELYGAKANKRSEFSLSMLLLPFKQHSTVKDFLRIPLARMADEQNATGQCQ